MNDRWVYRCTDVCCRRCNLQFNEEGHTLFHISIRHFIRQFSFYIRTRIKIYPPYINHYILLRLNFFFQFRSVIKFQNKSQSKKISFCGESPRDKNGMRNYVRHMWHVTQDHGPRCEKCCGVVNYSENSHGWNAHPFSTPHTFWRTQMRKQCNKAIIRLKPHRLCGHPVFSSRYHGALA